MVRLHRTAMALLFACVCAAPAAAKEFYVGEPIVKNDIQIVPHYLLGIEMSAMPKGTEMSHDAVHLEVDVHATKDEKHGLSDGDWVPYLTITYTIEKVGSNFKRTGTLLPMTAGDGPHYANNVALVGDGDYKLTYHFELPPKGGFLRHVDKATGVPDRWQPFSETWTFHFSRKPAE